MFSYIDFSYFKNILIIRLYFVTLDHVFAHFTMFLILFIFLILFGKQRYVEWRSYFNYNK